MRLLAFLTIGIVLALPFASCEKEYFKPLPVDPNVPVSFSADIEPLFISKCATSGCHNGAVRPNLLEGKCYTSLMDGGYVDTLAPDKSSLMVKVRSNMPPPSGLPAPEISKVLAWITQGAKEN